MFEIVAGLVAVNFTFLVQINVSVYQISTPDQIPVNGIRTSTLINQNKVCNDLLKNSPGSLKL